jgi:mRNA interferase RelE/StbE
VKLEFRKSFLDDVKGIREKAILQRLKGVIEILEKTGSLAEIPNIKKLKGGGQHYRIRIGDYRLGLSIVDDRICLVRFLGRKEIYRYFP